MNRKYRIKKDFWFLKAGLIIAENVFGDFFIPMADEDWLDCPIRPLKDFVIDGNAVHADAEHFELIKTTKKRLQNKFGAGGNSELLNQASQIVLDDGSIIKKHTDGKWFGESEKEMTKMRYASPAEAYAALEKTRKM